MKVDSWLAINPEGALWYRGLASVKDDPSGGPFAALLQRYGASNEKAALSSAPKRVVVKVHADKVISWDHAKLNGGY